MSSKQEAACQMRAAITDLPEPVPAADLPSLLDQIQMATNTIISIGQGVASHLNEQTQGGMTDGDVIDVLEKAEAEGVDLTEHGHFAFVLAARHGRVEVMRYLYGRKDIRPSEEALILALTDALDAGRLEAAKFAGKRILGTALASLRKMKGLEARVADLESQNAQMSAYFKPDPDAETDERSKGGEPPYDEEG